VVAAGVGVDVNRPCSMETSDGKRSRGHLTRQGPPLLRWALYEAGRCASRTTSPDHAYYEQVARRLGKYRAAMSVGTQAGPPMPLRAAALGEVALAPI
jgi:hypothetical protein